MTTSYRAATDEMFSAVLQAWRSNAAVVFGADSVLYISNIGNKNPIPGDVYWGRLSRQTIDSSQTSLSACVGSPGSKRYTEFGLLFIQLFGPRSDDRANDVIAQMAVILRNVLRRKGSDGSVWYRNARINELPVEDKFVRSNVVAEFNYDEVF